MTRKPASQKSRTHFEQVPLDVVKTVTAEEVLEEQRTGTDNVASKPVSKKTKPYGVRPDSLSRE
jgi:hypothetical protein